MHRFSGILAMTALAAPALAEDIDPAFPVPTGCIDHAVGSADCPLEAVIDGIEYISPGYFNPFRAAKMESFYMQYATNSMLPALEQVRDGDACAGIEASYFYGETSFIFLPPVDDAPEEVRDDFRDWSAVIDNIVSFLDTSTGGAC